MKHTILSGFCAAAFLISTSLPAHADSGFGKQKLNGGIGGALASDADEVEAEPASVSEDSAPRRAPAKESPKVKENTPTGSGGKIKVSYEKGSTEQQRHIATVVRNSKIFNALIDGLNSVLVLPRDVKTTFKSCGEVNAFFNPQDKSITMCYDLMANYLELFAENADAEDPSVGDDVLNVAVFTFFHELGHGLINLYDLPVTGKEEDAVDDLAALIALAMGEEGEKIVVSALGAFEQSAAKQSPDDEPAYWDEHSLDQQRLYSIACIIFGSNPSKFAALVGDDGLPESRAQRCPSEFAQKSKSWDKLLSGHIRSA